MTPEQKKIANWTLEAILAAFVLIPILVVVLR